jgi:hypothetical protein
MMSYPPRYLQDNHSTPGVITQHGARPSNRERLDFEAPAYHSAQKPQELQPFARPGQLPPGAGPNIA